MYQDSFKTSLIKNYKENVNQSWELVLDTHNPDHLISTSNVGTFNLRIDIYN